MGAVLALGLGSTGCTLVKPLVGAVVGPAVMLGNSGGDFSGCNSGEAVVGVLALMAVVGAGAGLITGIISDVRVVCGCCDDPTNNWWDPFKINNGACDR